MIEPGLLIDLYTETYGIVRRATAGLTDEESLREPPFGGNCLNWLVGHLTVARANILTLLGAPIEWNWAEARAYIPGSAAIAGAEHAQSLGRLLELFDRAQERLVEALGRLSMEELRAVGAATEGKPLGAYLAGYHTHEACHAGEIEVVRRLVDGGRR